LIPPAGPANVPRADFALGRYTPRRNEFDHHPFGSPPRTTSAERGALGSGVRVDNGVGRIGLCFTRHSDATHAGASLPGCGAGGLGCYALLADDLPRVDRHLPPSICGRRFGITDPFRRNDLPFAEYNTSRHANARRRVVWSISCEPVDGLRWRLVRRHARVGIRIPFITTTFLFQYNAHRSKESGCGPSRIRFKFV